ncbi:hypothetical protein CEP53_009477 [Fusarium sp. AF-6]|nr:hypothetical protein CEP53_009477 [Fusarium sp. AF-6]
MPSTPPAQQVPKATTGKRPPTPASPKERTFHPSLDHDPSRKLRIETGSLIPVSEIARVCQMMLRRMEPGWQVDHFLEFQIKPRALSLLQKEAERFIIKWFTSANNFAKRTDRTTIEVRDFKMVVEVHRMFKQLGLLNLKAGT